MFGAGLSLEPFAYTSGPRDAKIALVGQSWGEQEELAQLPFVGASGQELTRILSDSGIERRECFLTNVLAFRPPGNQPVACCGSKSEMPDGYALAPMSKGKYLLPEYLPQVGRLRAELEAVRPNVIVPLGAEALWAIMGTAAIGARRGATAMSTLCPGIKALPTYHPAAVLRDWSLRVICVADLAKAKSESKHPDIIRPERTVLINPTLDDLVNWAKRPTMYLAVDIETYKGTISCIGFARSRSDAIVVPFLDLHKPNGCYWPTIRDELDAWSFVRAMLESDRRKVFQNGLFDLSYILRMGLTVNNCHDDTMLLHHSLYPEMQKSLGFMGSIYTNESSWKLMNHRRYDEVEKRDE